MVRPSLDSPVACAHPRVSRRVALQAGAIGLLGLGHAELTALRAATPGSPPAPPRSVIFIFLSGGLSQIDSFDPKPDAPEEIRGEFKPIATRTEGLWICDPLPRLAQVSHLYTVVRSLTHGTNDHSAGHAFMLTGRSTLPTGFDPPRPRPEDEPSIAALANALAPPRNHLPPVIVLPDRIVHNTGRVIPGQFAGLLGTRHEPWFLDVSAFEASAYGAFPDYEFDHQQRAYSPRRKQFDLSSLSVPEGFQADRLQGRLGLLRQIDNQVQAMDRSASTASLGSYREAAASLLTEPRVRSAFDLSREPAQVLERYGNNSFGWSLLMSRRLVEAGVSLVQVNLGNNESWDTHGNAFPSLRDKLFPPTDRALAALLEDLQESGLLESTLVVMASEFGRTPRISHLPQHYKLPGRDHWGRAQSILLAGGGIPGGRIVGATDRSGGTPIAQPQTPENLAATIYQTLGIPAQTFWRDTLDRPFPVYHGTPIAVS